MRTTVRTWILAKHSGTKIAGDAERRPQLTSKRVDSSAIPLIASGSPRTRFHGHAAPERRLHLANGRAKTKLAPVPRGFAPSGHHAALDLRAKVALTNSRPRDSTSRLLAGGQNLHKECPGY